MRDNLGLKKSLYLLGPYRKNIPRLLILFLVSSFLDIIGIGLIAPYIAMIVNPDSVMQSEIFSVFAFILPNQQHALIIVFGLILMLVFFVKIFGSIYINRVTLGFSAKIGVRLRSQLMNFYQNMNYLEYVQRNSSEYIYSIHQLTGQFALGYVYPLLKAVSEGIVLILILILLAWSNVYALGLLLLLLGSVVFVYDYFIKHKIERYGRLTNQHNTQMLQAINEGLGGLKELRVLGKERFFYDRVVREAKAQASLNVKASILSLMPRFMLEFSIISFIVLLVFTSILVGYDFKLLIPELTMFGVAAIRLVPSATQIVNSATRIRHNQHTISTLHKDCFVNDAIITNKHKDQPSECNEFQSLQLQNIRFTYPGATKITINKLSINIHAGDAIGLIGESGSGKSTLVDILLGLIKIDSGKIMYNNTPYIEKISLLRSQVAYIPQTIFILDDTLEANITVGSKSDINNTKLKSVIEQAQLTKLVEQLPEGVNTIIGEGGARLSGGQRQRIAIARAFYHDRDIFIMDEATSALDSETEKEITKEIKSLKGKKTLIIIAHRLTTLESCDRIYKLEDGKIVDEGSYSEIVNKAELKP
jgi:ATP-binding cassette, subfamily B, bacterial PglK